MKQKKYIYRTCSHVHTPVSIGDYEIHAIASRDCIKMQVEHKDLGIYLDLLSWGKIRGVKSVRHLVDTDGGDVYCEPWPDFGVISIERLRYLVKLAKESLEDGNSLEVGCIGAHGRTGTFLAAMMIELEECSAKEAIDEVRSRYCNSAIESWEQESMLYKMTGEKAPPAPYKDFNQWKLGWNINGTSVNDTSVEEEKTDEEIASILKWIGLDEIEGELHWAYYSMAQRSVCGKDISSPWFVRDYKQWYKHIACIECVEWEEKQGINLVV